MKLSLFAIFKYNIQKLNSSYDLDEEVEVFVMTLEQFIEFRNTKIRNESHKRVVELFYKYLFSVTGDRRLLPDLIGKLLSIDLSDTVTRTACFNGIFDGSIAPFADVDLYIKFENNIIVYIYGEEHTTENVKLRENEYVIFVLTDNLFGKLYQSDDRYIYITDKKRIN